MMYSLFPQCGQCGKADVGGDHEDTNDVIQDQIPSLKLNRVGVLAQSVAADDDDLSTDVGFSRQGTGNSVRTACDEAVPAEQALQLLQDGNRRFLEGRQRKTNNFVRDNSEALVKYGQNPFAVVIGCADSRCPLEIMFDADQGDLFVLRNAGNTVTYAEGSMVGSVEYSVGNLHTNLIIVVGHTHCGAIAGATKKALSNESSGQSASTLDTFLTGLGPVAFQAKTELGAGASIEEIAAHAVKVNVFQTIEKLLTYSDSLRAKARSGALQLHGAIYDIATGKVEFLGQCPRQCLLLDLESALSPRCATI
jgi:carbonic anhydrase